MALRVFKADIRSELDGRELSVIGEVSDSHGPLAIVRLKIPQEAGVDIPMRPAHARALALLLNGAAEDAEAAARKGGQRP